MRPVENPIHETLDAAGIPWRASRSELTARYGVRRHAAYDWDVIEIDTTPPIIGGLLWPLSAQVLRQFPVDLPATQFTGLVHVGEDACENFRVGMRRFALVLGPGETYSSANSVEYCWSHGAARLRLTVWPPAMQQWVFTNPAHERDPRLKAACLLSIDTGFRPPANAAERAWLATSEAVARIETGGTSETTARNSPASQAELEYVRDPPAEAAPLFGAVGLSADRLALIFYGAQLYLIAVADVVGFHVARSLPAKGPGGSRLEVECRTRCAGLETKRLVVTASKGTEDLNALAAELSRKTARPFRLGEYQYDA
jgi:hypothetical protein